MKISLLFLQTVLEPMKYDSFCDAAARAKVGPAAIGYRLKKVEEWVGAGQLYFRCRGRPDGMNPENPNLKMTPAGKAFLTGVKEGIENICGARRDAQAIGRVKRVVKNKLRIRKLKCSRGRRSKVGV